MTCNQCGREVSSDEIGLTRKLVNRASTEFLCFACLENHFRISHEEALALVERFRKMGCQLFPPCKSQSS